MRKRKMQKGYSVITVMVWMLAVLSASAQDNLITKDGEVDISYEVKTIQGLNTSMSEFSPVALSGKLVFTTDREYNLNTWGEGKWKKNSHVNIFIADALMLNTDSMGFDKAKIFSHKMIGDYHSGPICFSADGNEAIFTKVPDYKVNKETRKVVQRPQLYSSKKEEGKWTTPVKLNFAKKEHSYGHPSLSADGKYLYFASDMVGGKGGKDLYVVERSGEDWGTPKNLETLNSTNDDVFPLIQKGELYFASDRSGGLGGLDLYKTVNTSGDWSTPETLGSSINSAADDFGMAFNSNAKSGYFSSNREGGKGNDDIYYFKVIESVTMTSNLIAGQFQYRKLSTDNPAGLEVYLVDDEGQIVMRTTTDESGKFIFRNLPTDSHYTIKLADDEDVVLTIFNNDSEKIAFLLSNKNGAFVYRKLASDNANVLSLIDEADIDLETNTARLSGQFVYERLKGDYPAGLNVYLIDEDGNIVYKTTTDQYGNFDFDKLPTDGNYTIKIDENEEDISLLIFNKSDRVTAELKKDEQGNFVYRKLSSDYAGNLENLVTDEGSLQFATTSTAIFGQFKFTKLSNEYPSGMKIEMVNDDGKVLGTFTTDEKGYFRLLNLPTSESFIFRINEDDPHFGKDIQLDILNRRAKILVTLGKDENSYFVYNRLATDTGTDITTVTEPDPKFVIQDDGTWVMYYNYNSSQLTAQGREVLDKIIDRMKKDELLKLDLVSHTDAKGTDEYNMKLSEKRTVRTLDYLKRKGIPAHRLRGQYSGERKPVNKCGDGCSDEQRQKNRRTEFKFLK
jgi:flagellar motor protein MotB